MVFARSAWSSGWYSVLGLHKCWQWSWFGAVPKSFSSWIGLDLVKGGQVGQQGAGLGRFVWDDSDGSRRQRCAAEQALPCRFSPAGRIISSQNALIFVYLQDEIAFGVSKENLCLWGFAGRDWCWHFALGLLGEGRLQAGLLIMWACHQRHESFSPGGCWAQ